jgi:hypothetical protein
LIERANRSAFRRVSLLKKKRELARRLAEEDARQLRLFA